MNEQPTLHSVLEQRERHRDWYLQNKDPIAGDRLLWQAQSFRHLVHLLPGETILEIGSGCGLFADALVRVSRGRNPITAARFAGDDPVGAAKTIEHIRLATLPGALEGRRFRYVVVQNILDRADASAMLSWIYDLLEDGGEVVCFESNPWNPVFGARNLFRKIFGMERAQSLVSQPELYELISEVGFIGVSARFTDFVYAPLPRALIWLLRNLSTLLENAPLVRTLAGRILIHAKKPPRVAIRPAVSLVRHETLMGAVSVVVPCHNEEMNVGPLVDGLCRHYDGYIHQIVLVDDNSQDDTRAVIEELARNDPRITPVFRQPPNGVGRALRDGYAAATGRYVLSMDCDFQHLLPELEDMFDAAAEGVDAVLGSRFSRHSVLINYPFGKILANRAFHLAVNGVFRCWRRDLSNNLKLMRIETVRRLGLKEPGFAANAEIGLELVLMGAKVTEVPVSWIDRSFDMGRSSFGVVKSGGGYLRVLLRLAAQTVLGLRSLSGPGGPA
jgi:dolichol-phosphate mannosyltransferase